MFIPLTAKTEDFWYGAFSIITIKIQFNPEFVVCDIEIALINASRKIRKHSNFKWCLCFTIVKSLKKNKLVCTH